MTFPQLTQAYLDWLRSQGKPSWYNASRVAQQWLATLPACPTRKQIKDRHARKDAQGIAQTGDYRPLSAQANTELRLLRTMIRWGIDQEVWDQPDPTVGIKKWKANRREKVLKFLEAGTAVRTLEFAGSGGSLRRTYPTPGRGGPERLAVMQRCEIRDKAFFGLLLFSGCRPSEARRTKLHEIRPYGDMGCWMKPVTKTKTSQELPLPRQAMTWITEWLTVRPETDNPYLFPGRGRGPLSADSIRKRWHLWRTEFGLPEVWTYDLRRTAASHISRTLNLPDAAVMAVLNHRDTRSMGHYVHYTFDALCPIIQAYADWLFSLKTMPQDGPQLPINVSAREPMAMTVGG